MLFFNLYGYFSIVHSLNIFFSKNSWRGLLKNFQQTFSCTSVLQGNGTACCIKFHLGTCYLFGRLQFFVNAF